MDKYRAWDKQDNRMIVHEQDFIPLKVCSLGVLRLDATHENDLWNIMPIERFELMKCTDIQDRNGVNIHVGDIVKFHYFYMGVGQNLGAVECEAELTGTFDEDEYGWVVKAIKGEHWAGYTGYSDMGGSSYIMGLYSMNESSIHESSFEIIGNIYEHKHLLNDQKEKA